jgi:hypothetical protein
VWDAAGVKGESPTEQEAGMMDSQRCRGATRPTRWTPANAMGSNFARSPERRVTVPKPEEAVVLVAVDFVD